MGMKEIMAKQMKKGDRSVRLMKVPADRRPTVESLRELDERISAQISANEAMRNRSMINAARRVVR